MNFLMIPTMDGAYWSLKLLKTAISCFFKQKLILNTRIYRMWLRRLMCRWIGHLMVHEKIEYHVEYDLHVYTCQRCKDKCYIDWDKENKSYKKVQWKKLPHIQEE